MEEEVGEERLSEGRSVMNGSRGGKVWEGELNAVKFDLIYCREVSYIFLELLDKY